MFVYCLPGEDACRRERDRHAPRCPILPRTEFVNRLCLACPYLWCLIAVMAAAHIYRLLNYHNTHGNKSTDFHYLFFLVPLPPGQPPKSHNLVFRVRASTACKPECIGHPAFSKHQWPPTLQAPRHISLLPMRMLPPCHGTGVSTKAPRRSICGKQDGVCPW